MFAEGRRLYSDNVCLLKAGGCIQTMYVCRRQELVFRQCMFAEGRRLYSDNVCLLKAGGCIQTKYVC